MTPRSSGNRPWPAIVVLSTAHRAPRKKLPASAGYRGSDLVQWWFSTPVRAHARGPRFATFEGAVKRESILSPGKPDRSRYAVATHPLPAASDSERGLDPP